MIPKSLTETEDAVETLSGLLGLLAYLHDTAPEGDWPLIREPVGFLINTMFHELHRARKGYRGMYDSHWQAANDDGRSA